MQNFSWKTLRKCKTRLLRLRLRWNVNINLDIVEIVLKIITGYNLLEKIKRRDFCENNDDISNFIKS
jgi:hypothetical protein